MLPLPNLDIRISEEEFALFSKMIHQRCGIHLGANKKELLKARLLKRLRFHRLQTFRAYYEFVSDRANESEIEEMIESVATNVTSFFREAAHFDFLTKQGFSELLEAKKSVTSSRVRGWCCATATGEETYSLLISLLEYFGPADAWDVKVLGTDISKKVLRVAKKGEYPLEKIASVPFSLRSRYFDGGACKAKSVCQVNPLLRARAYFRQFNLMQSVFPFHGRFDVIFCRNVMIYFDRPTQESMIRRLLPYLNDNGFLFLGHSESIIGMNLPLKGVAASVYQKIF